MKDIEYVNNWIYCTQAMDSLGWKYKLFSGYVEVKGKNKVTIGAFESTRELLNFLYGYRAGLEDNTLYEKENK